MKRDSCSKFIVFKKGFPHCSFAGYKQTIERTNRPSQRLIKKIFQLHSWDSSLLLMDMAARSPCQMEIREEITQFSATTMLMRFSLSRALCVCQLCHFTCPFGFYFSSDSSVQLCQITTSKSNENLHFNAAFLWKNKHTATEQNSGPGYRRVLKKIINFRHTQQSYKCLIFS